MSCGQPHETPCSEVLEAVYLYLDDETDGETREHVRIHLDECGPCLREYGIEKEFLTLLARKCGGDPVPDGLRSKVMVKLQQVRVELDQVEYRAE